VVQVAEKTQQVKLIANAKYRKQYYKSGDVISALMTDIPGLIIAGVVSADTEIEETDDELAELRTRGKELGIRGAHNMGEEKLRGAIKEAEQLLELREKAAALGIDDADKKDAETLTAEIAGKGGGGNGQ
jgi:hypothetical protein